MNESHTPAFASVLDEVFIAEGEPVRTDNSLTCNVRAVAAGHPVFAGHFPTKAILPAIFQLAFAESLAREFAWTMQPQGAHTPLRAIRVHGIRFRQPIEPGDLVEVRVEHRPGEPDPEHPGIAFTFSLRVDGAPCSQGHLVIGTDDESSIAKTEPIDLAGFEPNPDPEIVLPHALPARFVVGVDRSTLALDARRALGHVPKEHPLAGAVDHQEAHALTALEFAAQAAGYAEAAAREAAGEPLPYPLQGVVVAIRNATFASPISPVEGPLVASITGNARGDAMQTIRATAWCGATGRELVTCHLTTMALREL